MRIAFWLVFILTFATSCIAKSIYLIDSSQYSQSTTKLISEVKETDIQLEQLESFYGNHTGEKTIPELIKEKPSNRIDLFFKYSENMTERSLIIKTNGRLKIHEF